MNRRLVRTLLIAGVFAGALMAASKTDAGCWRWNSPYVGWAGYSYSYYGGYGGIGCCGPSYVSYYAPSYSYCSPCATPYYRGCGLLGRCAYRLRSHHYRYYWGGYNPCYTSCCSTCGYSDCCCGSGGTIIDYGTPSADPGPTLADPPAESGPTETQTSLTRDSAFLTVDVPAAARVLVNGVATRSTGASRRYVSRNLIPGFDYTYEVKAEVMVGGEPVTQSKIVQLRAGEESKLAFDLEAPAAVETALTIHVPDNAKVYLAGNQTNGTGPVRTFRTTKLSDGQSWSEYVVRVVVQEKGLSRSLEETITLRAGDQRELSFDFDIDKVASVR